MQSIVKHFCKMSDSFEMLIYDSLLLKNWTTKEAQLIIYVYQFRLLPIKIKKKSFALKDETQWENYELLMEK